MKTAALVVVLASAATVARADTITVYAPTWLVFFTHGPGPIASASTPLPEEILFDTALGTLERVDLRYNGSVNVTKTLDAQPGNYSVTGYVHFELSSPTGLSWETDVGIALGGATVTEPGPFPFWEGNSRGFPIVLTSDLDVFITGGSLDLTVTGTIDVTGPGIDYSGLADELGGLSGIESRITYTYTYTPIPEPGTALLLGAGLAGAAWLRSGTRDS